MSERRQLALLFAAVVALTAVGVVGATLFPEDCEGLEQLGDLDLAFADAAAVLPVDEQVGTDLQALGDELGIGGWRGAVTLPDDATVSRSEFGFFVVTDEDFIVLRPSMGIASAPRGRVGLDVLPTGTSIALRADDGETGVVNGEYELDRCGSLPPDAEVLALDRGFAVIDEGAEVALVTFSGDDGWRAPAVRAAHVTGDAVVLGEGSLLELRELRSGEVLDRRTELPLPTPVPWLDATGDRLLLPADGGVVPLTITDVALDLGAPVPLPFGPGPATAAVTTPGGIVAVGTSDPGDGPAVPALATDRRATAVALPDVVTPLELHASEDGHVGLVVEVEDSRALLVYGTDRAG